MVYIISNHHHIIASEDICNYTQQAVVGTLAHITRFGTLDKTSKQVLGATNVVPQNRWAHAHFASAPERTWEQCDSVRSSEDLASSSAGESLGLAPRPASYCLSSCVCSRTDEDLSFRFPLKFLIHC